MQVEGTILRGREFEPVEGRVVLEDGEITAVEAASVEGDDIVVPAFVNAHTHLGDSVAKEAGAGLSLDDLVAPPDGLKHRLLRSADRSAVVAAVRRSLSMMEAGGTSAFVDFREGGVEGVETLREALDGFDIDGTVLGRETVEAMEASDGFGASGARDADFERERNATRRAGKVFGIHAGERDSADINAALDLDPDFLVHMVHPEDIHFDRVEESKVPIVLCPRSNLATNAGVAPMAEWVERTTVALGTDNVMLNSPSMFREMEFACKLGDVDAGDVLRMATVNGAEIAGLNRGVIEEGREGKLLVLDGDTDNLSGARDPVSAVVRRAGLDDVARVVL
jgi:cytosine/adenosine deaminase-related metal-dependent hydrolase